MPRRSAASLAVANIDAQARRVKPPETLIEPCRALWVQLVESLPAERFHKSDVPLLTLYVRALYQASLAFDSLEAHGARAGNSINPSLKIADLATKQCATLAAKLRLCPSARMDRKVAGPGARRDHQSIPPWKG